MRNVSYLCFQPLLVHLSLKVLHHKVLVHRDLVRQVHVSQPLCRVHHVRQGQFGLLGGPEVVEPGDEEASPGARRVAVGATRATALLTFHLDRGGGGHGGHDGGGGGSSRRTEMWESHMRSRK
jgi:hypothetical protein